MDWYRVLHCTYYNETSRKVLLRDLRSFHVRVLSQTVCSSRASFKNLYHCHWVLYLKQLPGCSRRPPEVTSVQSNFNEFLLFLYEKCLLQRSVWGSFMRTVIFFRWGITCLSDVSWRRQPANVHCSNETSKRLCSRTEGRCGMQRPVV